MQAVKQLSQERYERPVDDESEKMVIATALAFPDTIEELVIGLKEQDFAHPIYADYYKVIKALYSENPGFDVVEFAERAGTLGSKVIGLMSKYGVSGAMMPGLIKKLKKVTKRRAIYDAAFVMASKALDQAWEPEQVLGEASQYIDNVTSESTPDPERIIDVVERQINNYQSDKRPGVETGWTDLDDSWAGFCPGEVTVLAARPSMGKTALAQEMAERTARKTGEPVLVFSLEMSNDYLVDRYISAKMGVNVDWFRRGTVPKEQFERTYQKVLAEYADLKLFLQDEPNVTTYDIQAQARKLKKAEGGLALVVVDYLTLIADDKERGESEHLKVQAMTRRLRAMAKNLKVPVLLLAQLSRELERRPNKRPTLPDLRESGGIEEAADNILFIYRDSYYNPECDEPNKAEIIIAKQKQGARGVTIPLFYDPAKGKWADMDWRNDL